MLIAFYPLGMLVEQATKTPWPISIPWLPGNENAFISPKTIHSGAFVVDLDNLSGCEYSRLFQGVLSIKKPPILKEAFLI